MISLENKTESRLYFTLHFVLSKGSKFMSEFAKPKFFFSVRLDDEKKILIYKKKNGKSRDSPSKGPVSSEWSILTRN